MGKGKIQKGGGDILMHTQQNNGAILSVPCCGVCWQLQPLLETVWRGFYTLMFGYLFLARQSKFSE